MITASGEQQRLAALESGADDFVTKPFDQGELLARVASLARIKRYHDTIERQAAELATWNAELERRVADGVAELERTSRLRHFLSPQLADLVVDDQGLLAVAPPRDRRGVLRLPRVHPVRRDQRARGGDGGAGRVPPASSARHVHAHQGTLERFTGDGIMVFFNDPVPCDDAGRARRADVPRHRCGRPASWRAGWRAPRPRPDAPHRDRPGLRHARAHRLRGPVRLRRHRQRHQPGGATVHRRRRLAGAA